MAPLRFVETIDVYPAPTLGIVGAEKQEHLGLQGGIRGGLAEGEDMEQLGGQQLKEEEWASFRI